MASEETETELWDRIRRETLEQLRVEVRAGTLTTYEFPRVMGTLMSQIRKHRDRAEQHDLWKWADALEASDPQLADFATFGRRVAQQRLKELGEFIP